MTKQELRQLIRQRKKQYSPEELRSMSHSIQLKLIDKIKKEDDVAVILLYHSLADEVDTSLIIDSLLANGKTVLLPTMVGDDLQLHIYDSSSTLATSSQFHIQESTGPVFADYARIDLAVVPGMAFTADGRRLGRGKGFYDRLLSRLACHKVGLAFPFQMVGDIPCEPHDIRMDEVM